MPGSEAKLSELKLVLREVINTLQDGQKAFAEIGEHMRDETMKRFFLAESLKRARFRSNLENELHHHGVGDVREHGTAVGSIRRAWADVKLIFGGNDLALLESAEQGEDASKAVYADALKQDLPLPVHQMLSEQSTHVQITHDFVRDHRDILRLRKAS